MALQHPRFFCIEFQPFATGSVQDKGQRMLTNLNISCIIEAGPCGPELDYSAAPAALAVPILDFEPESPPFWELFCEVDFKYEKRTNHLTSPHNPYAAVT